MRTVPFRDVFDGVVTMHGRDPKKRVNPDMTRAIVRRINNRVRTICQSWPWPEWNITEERAFREIWNSTNQYKRASLLNGQPDEVFYLGAGYVVGGAFGTDYGYYRVKASAGSDPSIGTVPTNTTYWETFTPLDTFIDYEQRCRRSIGMILGVYSQNPRNPTGSNNGLMRFNPSEKGIDVLGVGNPTVFVNYKMPVPEYSMAPYLIGKTYVRGNIALDYTNGECFQALDTTTASPSDTAHWRRVPFLKVWEDYVVQRSFADSLLEFDQGGNNELQAKLLLSQTANQRADDAYQLEVDSLSIQAQKLTWNFCRGHGYMVCFESPLLTTGSVSTLTSECQSDLGWVYPSTTSAFPGVEYHSEIVAVKTLTGTPSLQQLATLGKPIGSIVFIKINVAGSLELQEWSIESGAATVGNDGEQAPDDFNSITNSVHWTLVG